MKVFALTGGMASGKSTVAKMFANFGVPTIDADKVAHQIYAIGTELYQELLKRHGNKIQSSTGEIDRKLLGEIVFNSIEERTWLEAKTHPATRKLIATKIQDLQEQNHPFILVEAALHIETQYYQEFDGLIVVHVDKATQILRICSRDNIKQSAAKIRLQHQMPVDEKKAHGDWVINNSGSLAETKKQVSELFNKLGSNPGSKGL